jgi:hypothetical protein
MVLSLPLQLVFPVEGLNKMKLSQNNFFSCYTTELNKNYRANSITMVLNSSQGLRNDH